MQNERGLPGGEPSVEGWEAAELTDRRKTAREMKDARSPRHRTAGQHAGRPQQPGPDHLRQPGCRLNAAPLAAPLLDRTTLQTTLVFLHRLLVGISNF